MAQKWHFVVPGLSLQDPGDICILLLSAYSWKVLPSERLCPSKFMLQWVPSAVHEEERPSVTSPAFMQLVPIEEAGGSSFLLLLWEDQEVGAILEAEPTLITL